MTGKIKEQIESLSNINRTQKQLIGSLAHELKTPMTAIIGYADTLLTVRLTPERQEKALIYIENECRRLSRLSMNHRAADERPYELYAAQIGHVDIHENQVDRISGQILLGFDGVGERFFELQKIDFGDITL